MRVFNCDACGHPVFFDSVQCVHCGAFLAFLPQHLQVACLRPAPHPHADTLWETLPSPARAAAAPARLYKMCSHRGPIGQCNFALPADDPHALCESCRQTRWLPDLSDPSNALRWTRIESAKRQLFYTLARLGLAPRPGEEGPRFELLADLPGQTPVMTGHANGTITLNVVEADDAERARRRQALHEPYRTLLGHLRHESGHFFWERLVVGTGRIDEFRTLFGDERQDYAQALQDYYARDPMDNQWRDSFVSAYATAHPWEDWAESWAHYLHMVDLLETAASYGTCIAVPAGSATPPALRVQDPFADPAPDFDTMLDQWVPLTLLTNSLSRSLGQEDAYPFALSAGARRKLEFIYLSVQAGAAGRRA
ncbi:Uncharacterized protein conserved in bacteria (DUF2248) [Delftia tsuruhatensis]|uniref:zinc-binding metallopeptidase family protein n=1 Tax=Delftia tsuruhatensis TaxID=180282 RepID=UPI001E750773|nr:putative zinc-binding peptidase [Delftia tsuruhatensis]CAB5687964.1 Uncharacterized protein conserved in bacteria (DUF2248) [Delftia tsuruhatensis]CAC9690802.1 Uncharacterized protein conserved in bacteria (DUF2248) [Delftia tsuruhatensis]